MSSKDPNKRGKQGIEMHLLPRGGVACNRSRDMYGDFVSRSIGTYSITGFAVVQHTDCTVF
jgi:hypothetical protein